MQDVPSPHLDRSRSADETLVRIVAPHFVAGLLATNGEAFQTAPILRYMRGWTGPQVADYCKRKGWTWEIVPSEAPRGHAKGTRDLLEPYSGSTTTEGSSRSQGAMRL